MRYRNLAVATLLLMAAILLGAIPQARAALREEQVIYPAGTWQYADTHTRDINVLPTEGSWSYNVLIWPNVHWMRTPLSIPSSWQSSKRVLVHIGACAHYVKVYLNGNAVGEHYGPVAPYDADVTPYVNWSGSNTLTLALQDWTCLITPGAVDNSVSIPGDAGYAPAGSVQGPLPLALWVYMVESTSKLWTQDVRMQGLPKVRVTDAFVRPSVRQWKLDVDLTFRNDDTISHTFSIENYVTKWNQSPTEKSFTPSSITLAAGATVTTTVTVPWSNPILWSPNQPQLYSLVTTLKEGSTTFDTLSTRFGFREFWVQKSPDNTRSWFVLNGVRQSLRGESVWSASLGDSYVNTFIDWLKTNNYNCVRMCSAGKESYYDLADEKGILVVSEAGFYFNQQYSYDSVFWTRARNFMTDQVKAWRNHPSIIIWSIANEVTLTAPGLPLGPDLRIIQQAVQTVDPTRTVMCEGDGDLRIVVANVPSAGYDVPVINIHNYDIAQPWRNALNVMDFPTAAYVFGETTDMTQMPSYHWGTTLPDKSKPWYIGEFGPGSDTSSPHAKSFFTGDAAYVDLFGQSDGLMQAIGMNTGFQIDGMRYFDWICGIAPWDSYPGGISTAQEPWIRAAFKPVTTRIKELTRNFFAGDTVNRTLTVYNDDTLTASSFNLHWRLVSGSQDLLSGDWNFVSEPGVPYRNILSFTAPATTSRLQVTLVLELRKSGVLVDTMTQAISIWAARSNLTVPAGLPIYVYDRMAPNYSRVSSQLTAAGVSHTVLSNPNPSGRAAGLYIMGHAAYPQTGWSSSTITGIQNWIRSGGTLLVYSDQYFAPQWLSISGDSTYGIQAFWIDSTIGFLRAPSHPVLAGLQPDDCKWWAASLEAYQHYLTLTDVPAGYVHGNWPKPAGGPFTVLVDTGGRNLGLGDSPLCEYPDGKGQTIICTLRILDRLAQEPAARLLAQNILNYAATSMYRTAPKGLGVLTGVGSQTGTILTRAHFSYQSLSGLLGTYTVSTLGSTFSTILIDSDAAVWAEVDANRAKLQAFVNGGGRVILRKIDSARVSQANALTGVSMATKATQLRHPQLEKKTADPLLDGLSNDDVFWAYQLYWRTQLWAPAIVNNVITVAESALVKGLLVEPNRTGTLQSDSGWSYFVGDASRDAGVAIAQPGFGLVRVSASSGTGYYLVDQVLWDASMDTELMKKAQRYLATMLTYSLYTFPTPTLLRVVPSEGTACSGTWGGPFTPQSGSYTLTNSATQTMNWTATVDQPWLTLSSVSGTLGAGASTTVTASVSAAANALSPSGSPYVATVTFANSISPGEKTTRSISLTATAPVVGTPNKAVLDPIMTSAVGNYSFVLSGVVSQRTAYGFKIDDGSGILVTVDAPGNSVANGTYVSVKGTLNPVTKKLASQQITVF